MTVIIGVRAAAWYARRGAVTTDDHIRRYLRFTIFRAGAFSLLFGGWGLYLFLAADPFHTTAIALFIFVGSISCRYCLQVLPAAARLVLLFGAMPVTIGLLLSRDWYFTGMGLTFLLGAGVILRTIATTRSAVFESLRSRSEMATLIEALALDDFGTGYASLTHLQQFPVHVLKIDRSFISRLNSADSADFAIVHGVIDIAHRMNIVTVAEGVENDNQLVQLRSLGCDIAQGYLFSRAISAERVPVWLRKWTQNLPVWSQVATDRATADPPTRSA